MSADKELAAWNAVTKAARDLGIPWGAKRPDDLPATASDKHLAWAKERALEYVTLGDTSQAWASLCSDLRKHPDLANHAGIELGFMLLMGGHLTTAHEMRDFIEGFN